MNQGERASGMSSHTPLARRPIMILEILLMITIIDSWKTLLS